MSGELETCFASAMPFNAYRAQLTVHRDAFNEHYVRLEFMLDVEKTTAPLGNSRILILTEEYCVDSVLNVPLVARLVEASPRAALRIARRDENLNLASCFPGRGGVSRLPTVIFLGSPGQPVRYWSERAKEAHRWMGSFLASDPMPELSIEEGQPAPGLAAWMKRRYSSQKVVFLDQGWRDARDELSALATRDTEVAEKVA